MLDKSKGAQERIQNPSKQNSFRASSLLHLLPLLPATPPTPPSHPSPGHTGVHLDNDHVAVDGVDRHLHVGAAALDAHLTDDGDGGVTQPLVLLVGQRLKV